MTDLSATIEHADGRFGPYGGRYVPEALIAALDELDRASTPTARGRPGVPAPSSHRLLRDYAGRPSLLYDATRFSEAIGARVLLKREDLNHTGAHKINNVLGQALLTKRMGKPRVIAETGAGQHGVATATAAALFGLECTVYMGEVDTERQALNVARMRLLGAEVTPVTQRLAHAQGRHERGVPRLGDQRRLDALRDRLGRRSRAVPRRWCATSPPSSAPRRGRSASSCSAGCPTPCSPASAAAPTRWASSPRSSRTTTSGSTASRPAATASRPSRHAATLTERLARASCTARAPTSCRTRTARPASRTRSRPAWTTRASGRSTPG